MEKREYIAKFLGDLARIIFATMIVTQIIADEPKISIMIEGIIGTIGLFFTSLWILSKEKENG